MPIARVYETEQQAQDAAQKLQSEYPEATVHLVTPFSGGDATASMVSAGFDDADAGAYAAVVGQGRSVVACSPRFGMGTLVDSVLDEFGPMPMDLLPSSSRAASARYTPFSDFLGWRPLSQRTQQAWWWGEPLKKPSVTSFGLPRLTRGFTPLTSLLGLPKLKKHDVAAFGFPLLLSKHTPLSSMLGLPLLKKHDVASLGLPLLIRT